MLSLDQQNALRDQYRDINPGWRPATERFADYVRASLPTGGRLLDLGCGRGGLVEQLDYPTERIVGIDPDWPSLIEHRISHLPRAAGMSQRLPLKDNVIDMAYCSWLLEHLDQPQVDFAEIGRVLRPGGLFVFITPNAKHPLSTINRILGQASAIQDQLVEKLYGRPADDAFPTRYRANHRVQIASLADAAGLKLTTLDAIPDPTYLAFTPTLFRIMCQLEKLIPAQRKLHLVGILQKPRP